MLTQVSQHVTLLNESFAAVRTTVRSLVRVRASVRDQVSFAHEIFGAQVAAERPLGIAALVVRAHMEEEVALERETLATFCAHEWTFTSMATHVIHEMLLSCEWLGAYVATVRGISGVLTEMIIEMFFPGERPLAELTPVWRFASVDAHMIRQMLLTSK